ncbi:MAG: regulatory protein RecX [Candidatus Thiodiazotropha sp. 6PLUC1]
MGRGRKLSEADYTDIEISAVRFLAAREHSQEELRRKLLKRHYDSDQIERVLEELSASDLLSDARFTEAFVESRIRKGQGPVRIRLELRERGVASQLTEEALEAYADQWWNLLKEVHDTKFGCEKADSNKALAKRARFLESRGFPGELIRALLLD